MPYTSPTVEPAAPGALPATESAQNALRRVKYSHDAVIDLMIANPALTQRQLAAMSGFTEAWLSRIVNSDAFQARLAERKADLIDPSISLTFDEKLKAAADKSLEIIEERLTATRDPKLAIETLKVSSVALGYGARAERQAPLIQQFVVALPDKAQDSSDWASRYAGGALAGGKLSIGAGVPAEVVDVESKKVPQSASEEASTT